MDDEDDDFDVPCAVCGAPTFWEQCWQCHGEGGFHDCGEDTCCCLHPDFDLNEPCDECDGRGGYRICTCAARHPKTEAA